jgi:hypothetical protein
VPVLKATTEQVVVRETLHGTAAAAAAVTQRNCSPCHILHKTEHKPGTTSHGEMHSSKTTRHTVGAVQHASTGLRLRWLCTDGKPV